MRNTILRIISLVLAVFLVVGIVGCAGNPDTPPVDNNTAEVTVPEGLDISGNKKGSATVERTYSTLYAGSEDLVRSNPNRGFRGYLDFLEYDMTKEQIYARCNEWLKRHFNYVSATVAVCYFYFHDYMGKKLDDKVFDTMQYVFDYAKEKKITLNVRFAIHKWAVSERTPTTDEIMLHLNQIAENGIIERNKDVINVLQMGFVGFCGEWHSEDVPTDRKLVANTFLDKLLPDGVYTQMRMPAYLEHVKDNAKKSMVGLHHDCFYGYQDHYQLGANEFSPGYWQWDEAVKVAAYTPQDAECHFQGDMEKVYNVFPNAYSMILGMSQLRMTTFSAENGYLERGPLGNGAMTKFIEVPVTEKWCKENGIPYSENWFRNSDGTAIERNALEFIKDYLGYRLTATKLSTKEADGKLNVSLDIQNHGFSAAFNITSKLVILDKDGNKVSEVAAGDPRDWHTTNPDNYSDRKQLTHNIAVSIDLPTQKGEYSLALELMSRSGVTARLDANIPFEYGCNILHTFKI